MRRMRNPFGVRAQRSSGAAPKPIKMKIPKLDVSGLEAAYEWMVVDKLLSFRLAFEWYAENVPTLLFGDPLDADRQKRYDRATKSKTLGDSATDYGEERLHAYATSIHLYENVWPNRGLPKLDDAVKVATPSKRVGEVQQVLACLNEAYKESAVTFGITMGTEREYGRGSVLLPQGELYSLIGRPPIKVVMSEALSIAKLSAAVTDPQTGETELDGGLFMSALPTILGGISSWAENYSGNLARAFGKPYVARASKKAGASTARSAGATNHAPLSVRDPFGVFRPNTIKAMIASVLFDRAQHSIKELEAVCTKHGFGKGQVKWAFQGLKEKGHKVVLAGGGARVE